MNSKTDLATSIITAVIGVIIAYFVCNIFIGAGDPISVKILNSSVSPSLSEPNPELFNYKSLNPTVEVYVGECQEYDQDGNCIDTTVTEQDAEILEEIIEDSPIEDSPIEDEGLPKDQGQETE